MHNYQPIRDIYDLMPVEADPVAQRRHNKERLAELEAQGQARRARLEYMRVLTQSESSSA